MSHREFAEEVRLFSWRRHIWRVDLHHTGVLSHSAYRGLPSVMALRSHHMSEFGLDDIAPNVTVAPDGVIWDCRDWNVTPASIGFGMNVGVFMVSVVGDFERGRDRLDGAQLDSLLTVIDTVQGQFDLPIHALLLQCEVPVTKFSGPCLGIQKIDLLRRLRSRRPNSGPSSPSPTDRTATTTAAA